MTDSQAEGIEVGVREVVREARRLGLTWGLRPATVMDQDHVRYDGDDEETITRVLNILESPLFVNQRVMCAFVPPSGNFVIGSLTDTKILFRARRAAAQSLANATQVEIEWDTVDVDTHGGWTADFPMNWVAPFTGWYQLSGGVGFAGGTGGRRGAFWRRNHVSPSLDGSGVFMGGVGSAGTHSITARVMTVALEAGDSVQMTAFQENGAAMNTAGGDNAPSVDISYVRPPIATT